jgi:hypothetical protein
MAKFEYAHFYGDMHAVGFNAAKFSQEEALAIAAKELNAEKSDLRIREGHIHYGFGKSENGRQKIAYRLRVGGEPKLNAFKAWSVEMREKA